MEWWLRFSGLSCEKNRSCFTFQRLNIANKRLKRDCQRAAFPVPLSRGGFGCCV
ncbi:hypothetical protein GU263_16860 [Vibrio cholerae]|nr:hypothetical protein [Vibrio cholerae]